MIGWSLIMLGEVISVNRISIFEEVPLKGVLKKDKEKMLLSIWIKSFCEERLTVSKGLMGRNFEGTRWLEGKSKLYKVKAGIR